MNLLTTKDVCNMLKISIDTLNRYRKDDSIGFPEPIKLKGNNGATRWIESDIEEFLRGSKL